MNFSILLLINGNLTYHFYMGLMDNYMNFSYIIPGVLAGMALPGHNQKPRQDLDWIRKKGVHGIISLTEDSLKFSLIKEFGFEYLHVPVVDFTPPSLDQVRECCRFISLLEKAGKATVVHCLAGMAGQGRYSPVIWYTRENQDTRPYIRCVRCAKVQFKGNPRRSACYRMKNPF